MVNIKDTNLIKNLDKKYVWHPFTKIDSNAINIPITGAKDEYLFSNNRVIIDGISSWWTVNHGHCNAKITTAVKKQIETLDHVIFANFSHYNAAKLCERIISKVPFLSKGFFSDNGSTSVEVGIKMALQSLFNKGEKRKTKILAFKDAYHGDTFGAMSVSKKGTFTQPFWSYLFDVITIPVPTKGHEENALLFLKSILKKYKNEIACFIYEPLIQGAGGMVMYSEKALNNMLLTCIEENVILIADEVMTGFGRTGRLFASDYVKTKPDIMCLSKGITGGIMPLGLTLCNEKIYNSFISEKVEHTFYHGHSFTGNPISTAAAVANIAIFDGNYFLQLNNINQQHLAFKEDLKIYKEIKEVRVRGTILAIELNNSDKSGYFNKAKLLISSYFIKHGILLRPLGNIIYIMPPYCISKKNLTVIYNAIIRFIETNKLALQ